MALSNKLAVPATNVPRCGTITGVSFAASSKPNWDDQIRIEGMWEREGPGHFYQSIKVVEAYTDAGVVRQEGFSSDGRPIFGVVNPAQRVMIVRKEVTGSNAKTTEVTPVDVQGMQVALPACPKPVLQQAPVQVAVPPVAAPAAAGPAPVAAPAPAPAAPPAAAPPPQAETRAPNDQERKARERARWAELDEHYGACLAIAAYRLREALGHDVDPGVIQAGAATVMIQSERQALSALPGLAKQLRERLNGRSENERDPGLTEQEVRTAQAAVNTPAGEDEYSDYPERLDEADDDLPF